MEEKQTFRLGQQVLHQDDLEIEVTYNGEVFVLRYPNPMQRAAIENEVARRLGGLPRESYDPDQLTLLIATTYVDNLFIPEKCPNWFESAWTCYDDDLIAQLYTGYLRFRDQFRKKIRDKQFQRAGEAKGA